MSKVPEWALGGLHDVVWQVLTECIPLEKRFASRVLDVGAGPGKFSTRLTDAGFVAVACERAASVFAGKCHAFIPCDVNGDWAETAMGEGPYDAVVAQEVIEHIENPTRFMRDIGFLVKPGGYCIVTSPNDQDKASRIDFLFNGELPWFQLSSLSGTGHQTPMFVELFYLMAITAGFELKGFYGYGKRAPLKLNWKGRLFERYLDRKMRGTCLHNVINIWVLQKGNEPHKELSHLDPFVLAKARDWKNVPCKQVDVQNV